MLKFKYVPAFIFAILAVPLVAFATFGGDNSDSHALAEVMYIPGAISAFFAVVLFAIAKFV